MKLTRSAIVAHRDLGNIVISPWRPEQLNPNSYNLRLGRVLKVYDLRGGRVLDMAKPNPVERLVIPPEGFVLQPGILYLGVTQERTSTRHLVPCIEGRSSVARLGLTVHLTAGFGDHGFDGHWTLEMTVVHPLQIYAGVEVCQIAYEPTQGATDGCEYVGKYQGQGEGNGEPEPCESRLWMDFERRAADATG